MNTTDIFEIALTPGSPMNRGENIFRRVSSLATLADIPTAEALEILNGDMGAMVTIRASAKPGVGTLVALTVNIPLPEAEVEEPVKIMAGNAVAPAFDDVFVEVKLAKEGPFDAVDLVDKAIEGMGHELVEAAEKAIEDAEEEPFARD